MSHNRKIRKTLVSAIAWNPEVLQADLCGTVSKPNAALDSVANVRIFLQRCDEVVFQCI